MCSFVSWLQVLFVDNKGSVYLLLFYTDGRYNTLREDLEADARDFEAPTWSLAVDQQYLKDYSKEDIKRQDVIHGRGFDYLLFFFSLSLKS